MKEKLAASPKKQEEVAKTPIITTDPNTFIHCGKVYTKK